MTAAEICARCFESANRGEMYPAYKHELTPQERLVLIFFFHALNHQVGRA